MKVMSRNFTKAEKILLVLLAVLLIALIYYHFVYRMVNQSIASSQAEKQSIQADLSVAQQRVSQLEGMQSELDDVMGTEKASRMESYNNSKAETDFLSSILQSTKNYSIAFSDVTRNGNQIRRSFTLQFVVKNYKDAVYIVDDLTSGEYRCLVDDVNYSLSDNKDIYINLTATFFETMVGGTPDSALPPDESDNENVVTKEGIAIDDFIFCKTASGITEATIKCYKSQIKCLSRNAYETRFFKA